MALGNRSPRLRDAGRRVPLALTYPLSPVSPGPARGTRRSACPHLLESRRWAELYLEAESEEQSGLGVLLALALPQAAPERLLSPGHLRALLVLQPWSAWVPADRLPHPSSV